MRTLCGTYNLHNLVKGPTCFTNPDKPSSIDLILTNWPKPFINTQTEQTGLSDFHLLPLPVLKMHYDQQSQKILTHRGYKKFQMITFAQYSSMNYGGIMITPLVVFILYFLSC